MTKGVEVAIYHIGLRAQQELDEEDSRIPDIPLGGIILGMVPLIWRCPERKLGPSRAGRGLTSLVD